MIHKRKLDKLDIIKTEKILTAETTLPRERMDKLRSGRKYLQITCHKKNLITKYIKNSYNAIIRHRTQFLKWAKVFEQAFL